MTSHFVSNGKFLFSSEYLILKGALALAIPLNKGQKLRIDQSETPVLQWNAYTPSGKWFNITFNHQLNILKTSSQLHAKKLQQILRAAIELNKASSKSLKNITVTTHLEFNHQWGWGSSSTLLYLLGQWLQVDPWRLMDKTFGGSGYDIACAGSDQPIFYKRLPGKIPEFTPAPFNPPFLQQLGVVWLNQKQTSSAQVKEFLSSGFNDHQLIDEISVITHEMAHANNLSHFEQLLFEHEKIISKVTGLKTVQEKLFPDFSGHIKSLGAWGIGRAHV